MLLEEVCEALEPALTRGDGVRSSQEPVRYVDLTTGGAGHAHAVATRFAPDEMWLFDRDLEALAEAKSRLTGVVPELHFIHAPFSEAAQRLADAGVAWVHGILADLGVSSHQLDAGRRGFSFRADAPLDMRMDPSRGQSASEFIATHTEADIAQVLRRYGEEPNRGYGGGAHEILQYLLEGEPWQGKPTRVFAYMGMPYVPAGRTCPGIVLLHGGGGTALVAHPRGDAGGHGEPWRAGGAGRALGGLGAGHARRAKRRLRGGRAFCHQRRDGAARGLTPARPFQP